MAGGSTLGTVQFANGTFTVTAVPARGARPSVRRPVRPVRDVTSGAARSPHGSYAPGCSGVIRRTRPDTRDGSSRRSAASACRTWTRVAGCAWMRSRATSRTPPETTSTRLGWGAPQHLWVMRRIRVEVVVPLVERPPASSSRRGAAVSAPSRPGAGCRSSATAADGSRPTASWAHLGPDGRPARLDESFTVYAEAAGGRRVSTRLELADPPVDAPRTPWPLRTSDVDLMDHLNNAVHWQAVEQSLGPAGIDADAALRGGAGVPRRRSTSATRSTSRSSPTAGRPGLALVTAGGVKAVARLEQSAL